MVTAYVLIISKSGEEKSVLDNLQQLEQVKEAKIVYGEYDIVAKIEVESVEDLNNFLLEKVRPIKNIEKTSTLIVAA